MEKIIEKIDLKDRRILYELDKNARISFAQLGKKVGLSTEVVHYRVKRLEERGIITQYQTTVNYEKLELIHFKVCLVFNGISIKSEEDIYSKLKKIHQIIWIAKCSGEFDCMISCTVNTLSELNRIKDEIINIASQSISKKEVSITFDIKSFPRKYLIDNKEEPMQKIIKGKPKVDELDLKLLRFLSENARMPAVEIADKLSVSVKTIAARIKRLSRIGIISNFRLVIDYDKLGINFYKTIFYLKNPNEERIKKLLNKLNADENVIHNLRVIGAWDLEPEFEFEEKDEFQKTIQSLMDEFDDTIQRIGIVNIIKEYKYTFFYK